MRTKKSSVLENAVTLTYYGNCLWIRVDNIGDDDWPVLMITMFHARSKSKSDDDEDDDDDDDDDNDDDDSGEVEVCSQ